MAASSRRTGEDRECAVCGAEFYAPRRRPNARFCSTRCKGIGSRNAFTCETCGIEAYGFRNRNKRWCSQACAAAARRTGEHRTCEHCGGTFYVPRGRAVEQTRFCSITCLNTWQGRHQTTHTCKTCGNTFKWSPSRSASGNYQITYCSLPCRDADPERAAQLIAMNQALQQRRTTKAETAGYALLDRLGVTYQRQASFNGKFTPDALIPAARLVVQFDGDYWHDRAGTSTEPRIRRRVALDRSQDAYVRACGWQVVRLWASDLATDPDGCAGKIIRHVRPPS